jgi:hypothetical protein
VNHLLGGTHYLVLSTTTEQTGSLHRIEGRGNLDEALERWHPRNRLSPIFGLNGAAVPQFNGKAWLLFCGPVFPGSLEIPKGVDAYLSLGLFNLILLTHDQSAQKAARELVTGTGARWEAWTISDGSVTAVETNVRTQVPTTLGDEHRLTLSGDNRQLKPVMREYRTEFAQALSRASLYSAELSAELSQFDGTVRKLIAATENQIVNLGVLTIANAALSRHCSQTYSGTAPIFETECHVATHSLLGMGTASIAIRQVRLFVELAVKKSLIFARLQNLDRQKPVPFPLEHQPSTDAFWDRNHLFAYGDPSPSDDPSSADFLPLLTFFSPRDGFRSTNLSLSAPMEILSSCNSISWTAMTLTHEISHTVIDGVIASLLPTDLNLSEIDRILLVLGDHKKATSLGDQLRAYLMFALWRCRDVDDESDFDAEAFVEMLREVHAEATEVLTHLFDCIYFYRGEATKYVRSIWASWAVIPNIQHRIPKYLLRTLCALHLPNLRREDVSVTIDQLATDLQAARNEFPAAQYLDDAIRQLRENRGEYIKKLENRVPLIRFAHAFLESPQIVDMINRQPDEEEPPKAVLGFGPNRIKNPLRFVEDMTKDTVPLRPTSVWMLQVLAFSDFR